MLPERSWNTEDGKCETQSFILSWCTMNDSPKIVYLSHFSDSVIHFECVKWKICAHKLIHPINVLIRIRKCSILFDQPLSLDQDLVFFPSVCLKWAICSFVKRTDSVVRSQLRHMAEKKGGGEMKAGSKNYFYLYIFRNYSLICNHTVVRFCWLAWSFISSVKKESGLAVTD